MHRLCILMKSRNGWHCITQHHTKDGSTRPSTRSGVHSQSDARQHRPQHVIITYNADQMVVLDESNKDGRRLIQKCGPAYKGGEASTRTAFQRSIRYSILRTLAVDGTHMAVRVVEGSIDGREFFDLHNIKFQRATRSQVQGLDFFVDAMSQSTPQDSELLRRHQTTGKLASGLCKRARFSASESHNTAQRRTDRI
jgi:hypothetical protein